MTSISNIWKQLTSILSNLNNFHSLEVVDRVSETQLQVGENSDWIIWRLKGLNGITRGDVGVGGVGGGFYIRLFCSLLRQLLEN